MPETINIPGYRIEHKLGQGGMAAVYLAIQQSFEREVALKVMSPLLNSDPSFTTRFIREARIVAHIHHASIVPVFDVGEHQPYHYLSMEYLPGGDLKQRILRGRCSAEEVMSVCAALCGALDVAHRKGFVHRDIKPENVLFREDGTPVLTDFGIARAVDRGASLTVAGMLVGTPSYMSPEQVKGVELDGRSDLYSLGIVCYEMLTGTVPFRADSSMSVALKHLSDPMPELPIDLAMYQPFISCLTAKDRNDRYATGSEAVQALRALEGKAATAEATMVRKLPPEVTAMLAAKTARRRRLVSAVSAAKTAAMTGIRAAAGKVKSGVSRGWAARARLRALWDKIPKADLSGNSARWAGVAVVLLLVAAIGATLSLRAPSVPKVAGASAPSAKTAPDVTSPNPRASTAAPSDTAPAPEAQTDELTPVDVSAAIELPKPDPAADAAARSREAAEARKKRFAVQRLEEIRLEREAELARAQEDNIQRLLAAAKGAYAQGAYIMPAGDSAADRYREVLKMRANHPEAVAGLQRIANVLGEEARRAAAVGDADTLRSLVTDIGNLQPDHRLLPELENSLANIEASPTQRSRREAANLERVHKIIDKAYWYLARKPFDLRAADSATDQYDLAAGLMPMAPGLPVLKERIISAYSVAVSTELRGRDPKRAARVISYARKRDWMSPELEELDLSIRQQAPSQTLGAK